MFRSAGCVSPTRSVVIWASFVLAMIGWGGSLWSYFDHGFAAGVNPGFIAALSIGITFTITCCHSIVMPDKVSLYGLGWMDRDKQCSCVMVPDNSDRPPALSVVR